MPLKASFDDLSNTGYGIVTGYDIVTSVTSKYACAGVEGPYLDIDYH